MKRFRFVDSQIIAVLKHGRDEHVVARLAPWTRHHLGDVLRPKEGPAAQRRTGPSRPDPKIGEGLIVDHSRDGGLRIPLPGEVACATSTA